MSKFFLPTIFLLISTHHASLASIYARKVSKVKIPRAVRGRDLDVATKYPSTKYPTKSSKAPKSTKAPKSSKTSKSTKAPKSSKTSKSERAPKSKNQSNEVDNAAAPSKIATSTSFTKHANTSGPSAALVSIILWWF